MENQEYHPAVSPRRGEWIAWGLTLLVAAAWVFLTATGRPIHRALPFMAVFLLFLASGTSLSNWLDRRTRIRLDEQGVEFENGLRRTHLEWQDIQEIQVFPSSWGKKVRVIGPKALFEFRTLGKVSVQGEEVGRMGFPQGEEVLKRVIENSRLKKVNNGSQPTGAVYYAGRE